MIMDRFHVTKGGPLCQTPLTLQGQSNNIHHLADRETGAGNKELGALLGVGLFLADNPAHPCCQTIFGLSCDHDIKLLSPILTDQRAKSAIA